MTPVQQRSHTAVVLLYAVTFSYSLPDPLVAKQDESAFGGTYSFLVATGVGCVASALMVLLTWWFGGAADLALTENFKRRRASCAAVGP